MRICELKNKEVINATNCEILGSVSDVDLDLCSGKITALIIPGPGKIFGFLCRENEYVIPYECVVKIGEDIILVNVCPEKVLMKIL